MTNETLRQLPQEVISHLVIDESQRVSDWNLSVSGLGVVNKITPYRESDGSLWFHCWAGEQLVKRINGRFVVEVGYQHD